VIERLGGQRLQCSVQAVCPDLLEGVGLPAARVVDQDVDRSERRLSLLEQEGGSGSDGQIGFDEVEAS